MLFVLDTSSFRVLRNYYPERFPSFWQEFEGAVKSEMILSVREVLNELQRQLKSDDWLLRWARARREMFTVPRSEEAEFVRRIFSVPHFQTLVGTKQQLQGRPVADPFVIAAARVRSGSVVTEEVNRPNAAKIPNVCDHFGVDCMNLESLLEHLGWSF